MTGLELSINCASEEMELGNVSLVGKSNLQINADHGHSI